MKMNTNQPKTMGHKESSPEREVHSNTDLPTEDRKSSNKQPNPTCKRTRGTTTNKAQSKWKEGSNQDQSKINDIETIKTIQKVNESRS